ncbi:hypothetical protein BHE74_00022792 [Ensete ventricosum]|nr:hypothetical protein BHE74_00022792 [Ensete ventricosum]
MEQTPLFLRNSYWVLRHGKSVPNEKGLIVSSLENGTLEKFGLASEGFNQARLAGELLLKAMLELRERYFGPSFELLSHDKLGMYHTDSSICRYNTRLRTLLRGLGIILSFRRLLNV